MIEILGWLLAITAVSNIFYRKGIRKGIKHALLKLRLDQDQINLLNEELKKEIPSAHILFQILGYSPFILL